MALELGDIEVPRAPRAPGRGQPTALFFRVVIHGDDRLAVELWERGVFCGRRTISRAGSERLRARRIALAAAELARRLRRKRLALAIKLERDERRRRELERLARLEPPFVRLAMRTGAAGAAVGPGDLWLAGPSVGALAHFATGARLQLRASWLHGQVVSEPEPPRLQWLELSLAPSYVASLSPDLDLDLGLEVGAAVVHVTRASAVDGIAGQGQSWTARSGVHLRLEPRLTRDLRLAVGPGLGVVLRRVPVETAGGGRHLGGIWAGGTVSLLYDPAAPPRE